MSGAVSAAKIPMTNEPVTLMTSVPSGKVSPKRAATRPESQKRPTLPSAPPIATHRYASIRLNAHPLVGVISTERQAVFPQARNGKLHCRGKFILQPAPFGNCKAKLEIARASSNHHNTAVRCLNYFRALIVAVLLAQVSACLAQTNSLSVYDDALANGFYGRSWAAYSLINTSPVHSGTYSVSVSATNWQGVCFSRSDLDVSPYVSLSFWANGGTNGGQRIQVQGLLGNVNPPPNVYYRTILQPNTWQKITVPLAVLGVADKTNFTDIWIQLTPGGASGEFYIDDIELEAKTIPLPAIASSPPPAVFKTSSAPASAPATDFSNSRQSDRTLWIVGALAIIIILLGWLVFVLRRNIPGASKSLVVGTRNAVTSESPASAEEWKQRALAAEAMAGKQGQILREKIMPELTEFAKQSLVQGLYAQRNVLIETQQKAQQALTQLESQLTALHAPLQERIRVYEKRIAELEKEVETQGEEMRELTRATLLLVRKKLEDEKELGRTPGRFN